MITALLVAAALVLAPAGADRGGPDTEDGTVMWKNYYSATPEGVMATPTGPPCWAMRLADATALTSDLVCVTRSVYKNTALFSPYDGPIERRL